MPIHDHTHDGDDHKTAKRSGGYFPLAPGLLHDPRLSGLTYRQKFLFIALLTNAWRGADRNRRFLPGQVIRPLPELARDLGIRLDHLRADIARMVTRGLVNLENGSVVVVAFDGWYVWAEASVDPVVDSQNGNLSSRNGEADSQNGNPSSQNGVIGSQNGVTDSQNGVTEVPSAQRAQGFVPSVRRLSEVSSKELSEESSSDVLVPATAATGTSTAGDDEWLDHGTDSDDSSYDNGNGRLSNDDLRSSSPSGLRGRPERSEGDRRRHAAAPSSVNDPAGDGQVRDLLERAGLNPSLAERYCGTITPAEARDMIGVFTHFYVDKGLPEKVVPCVVSALSKGREHVQSVILKARPHPGYRRVEAGAGTTSGEPRREVTAEELGRSRTDNRRRREQLGELAARI